MRLTTFMPFGRCSLLLLLLVGMSKPGLGQAQTVGKWSTLSYTMPINPIHVALLYNGKILVVAGSGNCPPAQPGCPSGSPYGPANNSGALLLDPTTGISPNLACRRTCFVMAWWFYRMDAHLSMAARWPIRSFSRIATVNHL